MNDIEKDILHLIDGLVSANAVRKETIISALVGNSSNHRVALQIVSVEEEIIGKLSSCKAISNLNFGQWCRNHGINNLCPMPTLEMCLARGVFEYKTVKGNRYYYVKGDSTEEVKKEYLIWKRKDS